jgi:hypothetical protein
MNIKRRALEGRNSPRHGATGRSSAGIVSNVKALGWVW